MALVPMRVPDVLLLALVAVKDVLDVLELALAVVLVAQDVGHLVLVVVADALVVLKPVVVIVIPRVQMPVLLGAMETVQVDVLEVAILLAQEIVTVAVRELVIVVRELAQQDAIIHAAEGAVIAVELDVLGVALLVKPDVQIVQATVTDVLDVQVAGLVQILAGRVH